MAKMYSLLLSLILAVASNAQLYEDGVRGGELTNVTTHPYVVSLSNGHGTICAGVIISKNQVLTAARCLPGSTYPIVRVGSSKSSSGGSVHKTKKIIQHPKYGHLFVGNLPVYDVAIITVEPEFNSTTCPACKYAEIFNEGEKAEEGTMAVALGWSPSELKSVSIPIISNNLCEVAYEDYGMSYTVICAGFYGQGGKDICVVEGNYGAPLLVGGRVAGVASYPASCGDPQFPRMFTEVAQVSDWIKQNIK